MTPAAETARDSTKAEWRQCSERQAALTTKCQFILHHTRANASKSRTHSKLWQDCSQTRASNQVCESERERERRIYEANFRQVLTFSFANEVLETCAKFAIKHTHTHTYTHIYTHTYTQGTHAETKVLKYLEDLSRCAWVCVLFTS